LSQLRGIDESAAADFRRELTSEHAGHHLKIRKELFAILALPNSATNRLIAKRLWLAFFYGHDNMTMDIRRIP
jgi:hypothetical protein